MFFFLSFSFFLFHFKKKLLKKLELLIMHEDIDPPEKIK